MIYLFELASTNPGDWYFDMQDLVSVVTFDEPSSDGDDAEANAGDYVNFIRQIQQDSGVEWDVSVSPDGNQLSPEGVSNDGSFFQLWSIHNSSADEYLLDEQFVTSYTPNAEITIETGDPYEPVARTRVDQPFTVNVAVNGLLPPGPDVPLAARQVAISHETFNYPEGQHSLENVEEPESHLVQQGYLDENGEAVLGFSVCNLEAADITTAEGEEVFTVSALPDYSVSATVLDSRRLQIWPIARGKLSGFDPDHRYDEIPAITITLEDLYPSSATYLRVYPGGPASSPESASIIPASYVLINDSIPQDRVLALTDVDSHFRNEGLHTVEILHETPFGTGLLHRTSLHVDRTITARAGIYTGE